MQIRKRAVIIMKCIKFDTRTFRAVFDDGDTTIIHIEKGDVDKAIEIVYKQMDIIEHPKRYKLSREGRFYYYRTYHTDIFDDALSREHIKAEIWN